MKDTLNYDPYDPTIPGKERSYLKPYAVEVEFHERKVVVHHSPDEVKEMGYVNWERCKPKNYRVVADYR